MEDESDHRPSRQARTARGARAAIAAAVAGAGIAAALLTIAWIFAYFNGDLNPLDSNQGPDLLVPLGITGVGAIIVARRSRNLVGWLFLFCGVVDAARSAGSQYAIRGLTSAPGLPAVDWAAWISHWLLTAVFPSGALLFIVLLFPNGHLLSPRWRVVAWAAALLTAVSLVILALDPSPISLLPGIRAARNPFSITGSQLTADNTAGLWPAGMLLFLVSAASAVLRYRRSRGEERQQIKWFAFAVGITVAAIIATLPSTVGLTGASVAFNLAVIFGVGIAIPIACAVAILKYRLYGIDVVLSRTLVFGSLAALITGVYVAIAVGIGTLVGSGGRPNLGLSILATAIVAVGFQPVRGRLQRIANQLVYGQRATPYEVLSEFSGRVAETYAAEDVLPRMAEVLREGTGAAAATVWIRAGAELRPAATSPASQNGLKPLRMNGPHLPEMSGSDTAVPVLHQGDLLGALTINKRRGESLTPIEQKLLDDLANQAGLVLKNVGLTTELLQRLEELRASRQRLVAAQDQERRRLERNLHDGAQQHLVALKVKLGLAEVLMTKDADKARATLQALKADADEALDTLRELARGIYPPILADQGLKAALESQARKATVPVTVEARGLKRYAQDVEATVYFCVLEAMQNVQKYAAASRIVVQLNDDDGGLRFEVRDDGHGFDVATVRKGTGLTNMADRLDALGGHVHIESHPGDGCRVRGWLPISAPELATALTSASSWG